jgi:RNA polymerase sigma factor (sigma-70 family)
MSSIYKTEADILAGCKANKREAQKALYKNYVSAMNAVSYRYTKSFDDAKDIVHDSFLAVFDKIHTYSGSGSLGGWIRKIVVNKSLNFIKSKQKTVDFSQEESGISYSDMEMSASYIQSEDEHSDSDFEISAMHLTKEDILEGINKLNDNHRIIFNLFVIDGYSHKSISETLQISEETSRVRLKRSREALQKILLEMVHKTKLS